MLHLNEHLLLFHLPLLNQRYGACNFISDICKSSENNLQGTPSKVRVIVVGFCFCFARGITERPSDLHNLRRVASLVCIVFYSCHYHF